MKEVGEGRKEGRETRRRCVDVVEVWEDGERTKRIVRRDGKRGEEEEKGTAWREEKKRIE